MPVRVFPFEATVRFCLALCASAFLFDSPGLCSPTTTSPLGWHVKQTSYNLGQNDILLTTDGMRWHNEKLGITLLMHAPDWNLNAYNEANKKYLVLSKEEALELFQHQRRKVHAGIESPIRLGERPSVAGMPTMGYCYPHGDSVPDQFAIDLTKSIESGKKLTAPQKEYLSSALNHQRREYWLSKDIIVSPHIRDVFIERTAPSKYRDHMPLRLIQYGKDGSKTTLFDTTMVRKTTVLSDTFKMPSGYTRAENKIALLVNEQDFAGGPDQEDSVSKVNTKRK